MVRYQNLRKTGAIDQASLDQARSAYLGDQEKVKEIEANLKEARLGSRENLILAQQAAVEAAKSTVKKLSWSLEQKTVRSRKSALVFNDLYQIGEFAVSGQPLVSVLTADNIKLIFGF